MKERNQTSKTIVVKIVRENIYRCINSRSLYMFVVCCQASYSNKKRSTRYVDKSFKRSHSFGSHSSDVMNITSLPERQLGSWVDSNGGVHDSSTYVLCVLSRYLSQSNPVWEEASRRRAIESCRVMRGELKGKVQFRETSTIPVTCPQDHNSSSSLSSSASPSSTALPPFPPSSSSLVLSPSPSLSPSLPGS